MKTVPEHVRKLMSPQDRKRYGLPTTQETAARNDWISELEMHDKFLSFLRRYELGYYHPNPTQPSTIKKGMPDFGIFAESRIFWIEFKTPTGTLSPAQEKQIATMVARKNIVFVCRSYEQATELTRKFFHLKP